MSKADKVTILVVDDEPSNFDVIETLLSAPDIPLLSECDCQLYYAANGKEAIAALDTYRLT